jgi:putative DNA methylase
VSENCGSQGGGLTGSAGVPPAESDSGADDPGGDDLSRGEGLTGSAGVPPAESDSGAADLGGDDLSRGEGLTGSAGVPPAESESAAADLGGDDPVARCPWYSRGYLPHYDEPGRTQFITFRLWDSVPKDVIRKWQDELSNLPDAARRATLHSRVMRYVDLGMGSCLLRKAGPARIVEDALLHFDGVRYGLLEWVVMPNHVHVLIEPACDTRLATVLHSWKSFTVHAINASVGRCGPLWEHEFYDRYIRDMEHLGRVKNYIEWNPAKAGLCKRPSDWRWSSAWRRGRGET